jgi:hypothetical protein
MLIGGVAGSFATDPPPGDISPILKVALSPPVGLRTLTLPQVDR